MISDSRKRLPKNAKLEIGLKFVDFGKPRPSSWHLEDVINSLNTGAVSCFVYVTLKETKYLEHAGYVGKRELCFN